MWNCPKCKQTIPELLSVKIDKERVEKYKEEMVNSVNKRIQLREMVKEHNRYVGIHYKKPLFLCEWNLSDGGFVSQAEEEYTSYFIIKHRKVIEKVVTPSNPKYEYLECPMCSYREYI